MTLVGAAVLGQRVGRFADDRPHWIGILFMILLGVLVVAAIVALIMWMSRTRGAAAPGGSAAVAPTSPPTSPAADARRILDERLARGEIDPEEYRTRRGVLES